MGGTEDTRGGQSGRYVEKSESGEDRRREGEGG
jgi:hypothetical protein